MRRGKRIYISGPISGMPNDNRYAFSQAYQQLADAGYTPLNPMDFTRNCTTWQQCMRRAIETMMKADGVALLEGHEKSKGSSIERALAFDLGITPKPLTEWLR